MPGDQDPAAIRHILCPLDVSDTSEFALTYAARLARKLGARITALHVFELPTDIFPDDVIPMRDEVEAKLRTMREQDAQQMLERCTGGVESELITATGQPHDVICEQAAQLGVDMIVMGTHGRRALGRLMLGSVAEHVLRESRVPVMTIRKPGH